MIARDDIETVVTELVDHADDVVLALEHIHASAAKRAATQVLNSQTLSEDCMKLKAKERDVMRHLLQHTIRIRNHEVENPEHFGEEHAASLARYKHRWAGLDPEQRAESVALLKAAIGDAVVAAFVTRHGIALGLGPNSLSQDVSTAMTAHPDAFADAVEHSYVADLSSDAIAAAIAYLESSES